jgi:hypothetical protein
MRRLLFGFALLLLVGCKPTVNHSQDPEAYAKDVKQIVYNQVASAAKSREPADQMQSIITELEQKDRPHGNYKGTYAELLSTAREIHADAKKVDGRPSNLMPRLNKLKQTAESLPGQVDLSTEK